MFLKGLSFLMKTKVEMMDVNRPCKHVPLLAKDTKRRRESRHPWNGPTSYWKVPLCCSPNVYHISLPVFGFTGYIAGNIDNSAKTQILFTILEEAVLIGDKLLLFSQSLYTLDLIEELLQLRAIPGTFWLVLSWIEQTSETCNLLCH